MAGVARGDINVAFAWQVWRLWHWVGFGGAFGHVQRWLFVQATLACFDWNLVQAMLNVLGTFLLKTLCNPCCHFLQKLDDRTGFHRWPVKTQRGKKHVQRWLFVQAAAILACFDWNLVHAMFNVLFGLFLHKLCASNSGMSYRSLAQAMFSAMCYRKPCFSHVFAALLYLSSVQHCSQVPFWSFMGVDQVDVGFHRWTVKLWPSDFAALGCLLLS